MNYKFVDCSQISVTFVLLSFNLLPSFLYVDLIYIYLYILPLFAKILAKFADKIKSTFQTKQPTPPADLRFSFDFEEVDEPFVFRELSSLKTIKATGLNHISAKLLKDSASTIASSLTKIFYPSLLSQTFPDIYRKNYSPLQIQRPNST